MVSLSLSNHTTARTRGIKRGMSYKKLCRIHAALSPPASVLAVSPIISGLLVSAVMLAYDEEKIVASDCQGTPVTAP